MNLPNERLVRFMVTEVVIMGILVTGVMALLFDFGMRWLERRLVPWKGKV